MAGRPLKHGPTVVKRIPKVVWDEAETFSLEKRIHPTEAMLELWQKKAHNDEPNTNEILTEIKFSDIERPKERNYTPLEIVRLGKLIERLNNECINPIIVKRIKPFKEGYQIVNGELQYLAYEALKIKRLKVLICEPNGDLQAYQEQCQMLRNHSESAELLKLREQKEALKTRLNVVQEQAQKNIDLLTKKLDDAKGEIERLAGEYSDLKAKGLQDKKADKKATKRKPLTLEG